MGYQWKCPYCQALTRWEGNPYRPFCSLRCRTLDLGHWLNEDYAIPGERKDPAEEEQEPLEKKEKSPTIH